MGKRYPFSEKEILRYFAMICVAVHYVHSNDIVHRDVNPSNILISNQANVKEILKLGGFGMSVHEKQNI
jgi:serine/threonine protein kinase